MTAPWQALLALVGGASKGYLDEDAQQKEEARRAALLRVQQSEAQTSEAATLSEMGAVADDPYNQAQNAMMALTRIDPVTGESHQYRIDPRQSKSYLQMQGQFDKMNEHDRNTEERQLERLRRQEDFTKGQNDVTQRGFYDALKRAGQLKDQPVPIPGADYKQQYTEFNNNRLESGRDSRAADAIAAQSNSAARMALDAKRQQGYDAAEGQFNIPRADHAELGAAFVALRQAHPDWEPQRIMEAVLRAKTNTAALAKVESGNALTNAKTNTENRFGSPVGGMIDSMVRASGGSAPRTLGRPPAPPAPVAAPVQSAPLTQADIAHAAADPQFADYLRSIGKLPPKKP